MSLFLLTIVAKQSTLFNDKSMQIHDLTLLIKEDISQLNRDIGQLQEVLKKKNSLCFYWLSFLFKVHAKYFWIEIKKFTYTFQFSCFCFTSRYLFYLKNQTSLFSSRN